MARQLKRHDKTDDGLFLNFIEQRLVSKAELAEFLQVSERSIDRYRKQGLPSLVVGGRRRFMCREVVEWFRAQGA
jgi:phage terminase Nu1 subunit (DNA packaging protein)